MKRLWPLAALAGLLIVLLLVAAIVTRPREAPGEHAYTRHLGWSGGTTQSQTGETPYYGPVRAYESGQSPKRLGPNYYNDGR